ncbi:LOW QUALITY PROTEIN: fibroblast growth factor receptor-like 1 [Lepeophtheirus salmonis]|uniref:LOW QUALITY PROTEIN: fibroblast growth factor receptor-like 1 n=1 Tax=Lepeophtheirus salmonis TaxID=72036 RepID=UPI003AF37B5E
MKKKTLFDLIFTSSLYLLLHLQGTLATIKGPPTAEKKEVRQIVRVGHDVRLMCPMSGHPSLMFEWTKDLESIQEYSWTRFRKNKKYLRITKTSLDDSGTYHCKGTNGFGSEVVRIQLIVIDPRDFPHLDEGELPDVYPPEWTPSTRHNLRDNYGISFGQKFHLSCEAKGQPTPSVKWYFNGRELYGRHSGELIIEKALDSDSGVYTCIAKNVLATITRNVSLSVSGKKVIISDLLGRNSLENMTVEEGDSAALECKVSSPIEPNIKWLKRLETWEHTQYTDVIEVENKKFRFIRHPESVSLPLREGEFVNTLIIPDASLSDSGMYYCFIALRVEYEFKNTYLTVIPISPSPFPGSISSSSPFMGTGDPILIVIICLSIFVFFLLISIILCIVFRRRNKGESSSLPESPDVQENLMPPLHHMHSQSTLTHPRMIVNKLDMPLPAPPMIPPQSSYYESSSTLSTNYLQSGYYPPPPTSIASGNEYEVPHVIRPPSSSRYGKVHRPYI